MVLGSTKNLTMFYDNLILSGTKISDFNTETGRAFYDNLILSGTKMVIII